MSDSKQIQIIVFSGPSGSGKNTLMKMLLERCSFCKRLITATTRKPRPGEQDGVDYYYLSKGEFLRGIDNGNIPEYRHIEALDTYYGTYLPALNEILKSGKIAVAQVDIIGMKFFKKNYNTVSFFIDPPSFDVLVSRIKNRAKISDDELDERLRIAKREIEEDAKSFDYRVVNPEGHPEQALDEIIKILRDKKISI